MSRILEWLRPVAFSLLFCAVAGMCNAAMDKSWAHFPQSVFSSWGDATYFDPQQSWKNKWKLDERGEVIPGVERYLWSSTLFVGFTDFWHLAKFGMIVALLFAMLSYRRVQATLRDRAGDFLLLFTAFTGTFTLFFDRLLLR